MFFDKIWRANFIYRSPNLYFLTRFGERTLNFLFQIDAFLYDGVISEQKSLAPNMIGARDFFCADRREALMSVIYCL